jgi:hypothetical protein
MPSADPSRSTDHLSGHPTSNVNWLTPPAISRTSVAKVIAAKAYGPRSMAMQRPNFLLHELHSPEVLPGAEHRV